MRMMPRDVRTRWNSTYDMLKFAYTYRDAIDKLTGERALKLRDYELSENEWELVMQLRDCLKVSSHNYKRPTTLISSCQIFKMVTLEFSSDTPCPASVIPAMDRMHDELTNAAENVDYSVALRSTLSLGIKLLNKYYSLTDNSEVYRIAVGASNTIYSNHLLIQLSRLVLHPRYKLKYFKKLDWDQKWIKTAEGIICDEFKRSYADYVIHKPSAPIRSSKKNVSSSS